MERDLKATGLRFCMPIVFKYCIGHNLLVKSIEWAATIIKVNKDNKMHHLLLKEMSEFVT